MLGVCAFSRVTKELLPTSSHSVPPSQTTACPAVPPSQITACPLPRPQRALLCPLPRPQRAPFPDRSVPPSQTCCFLLPASLRQWTVSGTRRLSFHRYCTSMCAYNIQYLVGLFDYACAASPLNGNAALELKMYLL